MGWELHQSQEVSLKTFRPAELSWKYEDYEDEVAKM